MLWIGILLLPLVAVSAARIFHNSGSSDSEAASIEALTTVAWPGPTVPEARTSTAATSTSVAPVETLIERLVERLAANPGDAKGWALLAQSYAFLGDTASAEPALQKAVELGLPEDDMRRRIEMASATPDGKPLAGVSAAGTIRGIVRLADGLDSDLPNEARLFITAKATDGSPAPVAVVAGDAASFRYEFTLTDESSMLPGVKLSDFEEVAIAARISRSGTAMRGAGDLESATRVVQVRTRDPVELIIEPR